MKPSAEREEFRHPAYTTSHGRRTNPRSTRLPDEPKRMPDEPKSAGRTQECRANLGAHAEPRSGTTKRPPRIQSGFVFLLGRSNLGWTSDESFALLDGSAAVGFDAASGLFDSPLASDTGWVPALSALSP